MKELTINSNMDPPVDAYWQGGRPASPDVTSYWVGGSIKPETKETKKIGIHYIWTPHAGI